MSGERIGNSNQFLSISGVVSAPAYSWASDNNTGIYRIGANNIGVAADGAKVLDIATTGLTVTGALSATTVSFSNALPVASGGTGLTSTPSNGQIDIGNGTGFTRAAITAGSGISVTNGSGTITIAATGGSGTVTSVAASGGSTGLSFSGSPITSSGTLTLAGTLAVANGGTGGTSQATAQSALGVASATGSGASGTWGISISGNAATATSATNATTATNLSGGTVAATTITATGNITAYFSDDRLKTRLGYISGALAKVMSLNGFYYEANEVAQQLGYEPVREVGLSAQDVQAVLPEVIAPAPIDPQYLTLDYARLVPLLVEAIKEQQILINALSAKVNV